MGAEFTTLSPSEHVTFVIKKPEPRAGSGLIQARQALKRIRV